MGLFEDMVVVAALLPDLRGHTVEPLGARFRPREAHVRDGPRDPTIAIPERVNRYEPEVRLCGLEHGFGGQVAVEPLRKWPISSANGLRLGVPRAPRFTGDLAAIVRPAPDNAACLLSGLEPIVMVIMGSSFSRSQPRRSGQYPLATVAAYGPDNTRASKLVVTVLDRPGRAASASRAWTTQLGDVRQNPLVAAEVAAFVQQHHARETVEADRIIGCPHEEGIDYPLGRACPRCPFWQNIDRFTHQPLAPPATTMAPADVLAVLSSYPTVPPRAALESADGHRAVLVEPLLRVIDAALDDPSGASEADASLCSYALYLLAKWREPRAYPYLIRWLSLPGEGPFDLAGDIVTQDGARMLAAVCDGDLDPIKGLVLDRRASEYGRSAGVTALARLAAWAEVPRASVVTWFGWLAEKGLEREPSQVWNSLAVDCADLEALELFPALRRAYDAGLVDPQTMRRSELNDVEAAPRGSVLESINERYPPIDDVVHAISWWGQFEKARTHEEVEPYRAAPKVGRNESCPCGSGRKFKKCCGR